MKIILCHRCEGGTGITNFLKRELPIMEQALQEFNDSRLIICSKPMVTRYATSENLANHCHSLHALKGLNNLSNFWDIVRNLSIDKTNLL
jgi:hypothetical protein